MEIIQIFYLLLKKKYRWEIKNNHKYKSGIDETMSIDNCTHSFFGASKTYADLIVQEYGKNVGLKTSCFRAGCITGPNHSGAKLHGFLSFVRISLKSRKILLIKDTKVNKSEIIFIVTIWLSAFGNFIKNLVREKYLTLVGEDFLIVQL